MAPMFGVEVLSRTLWGGNTLVRYIWFTHRITVQLAVSSVPMKQQCILNKVSLNRNTHKISFCIYQETKKCDQRLAGT